QGPLVRRAAATAFREVLSLASAYLGVSTSELVARDGSIGIGPHMERRTPYGRLVAGQQLSITADYTAPFKDAGDYTVVGKPVRRVDLPDKFTGKFNFVSDIVLPGMLHGRVVRNDIVSGVATSKPKNATFGSLDDSVAQAVPGFVKTVQMGNFVGVVASTEWGAIQAARGVHVTWQNTTPLVSDFTQANLDAALRSAANTYSSGTQEVVGNADTVYSNAAANL